MTYLRGNDIHMYVILFENKKGIAKNAEMCAPTRLMFFDSRPSFYIENVYTSLFEYLSIIC